MRKKIEFTFGDVFASDNTLSVWILKLAMARNDILYVNKRLQELADVESNHNGEMLYYFRIAASHYREIVKIVDEFHEEPTVIEFVRGMDKKAQRQYKSILESCTPWNTSYVNKTVKKIRDNLFHYSLKSDSERKLFEVAVVESKDETTSVRIHGETRKDIDFAFADELTMLIAFGNKKMERHIEDFKKMGQLISSFGDFAECAVVKFFFDNGELVEIEE